jgi:transposase
VGGGWPRLGQPCHDEPRPGAAGSAPQKKSLIATERDEAARTRWRDELAGLDPATVVFVDETSTQTTMIRARGRAPRGERVVAAVPRNHGANITCLAALTPPGIGAPLVIEGAMTGEVFLPWVRDWLLPTLGRGATVVMDNLNVHRNAAVRQAIEAAGCHLIYLPAYSPDFNPIERAFAKLKAYLRGVAARTFDPLVAAIGAGLGQITCADIAGYYRHCGFALPLPASQPS